MHPADELRYFRETNYITDEEEASLKTLGDCMTYRFTAYLPDDVSDNATIPGSEENVEAVHSVKIAIQNQLKHFDIANASYAEVRYDDYDDKINATIVLVMGVVQLNSGSALEMVQLLQQSNKNFTQKGLVGNGWQTNSVHLKAYSSVRPNSVYQIMLRLSSVKYLPQYADVLNALSLTLVDKLIALSREMHKHKFGEFFFRTVAFNLIESPKKTTMVSLAVLLEPNLYNLVDIDVVWKVKAMAGYLDEWKFTEHDFLIKETKFVPSEYKAYLYATNLRADLALNTDELWMNIGAPSLACMAVVILVVIACAWEGFICRKCLEEKRFSCFGMCK